MKERINKFFSLLTFLILVTVIISLGISSAGSGEKNIFSGIEVSGGNLLKSSDYLAYSGLKDTSVLAEVSLSSVKNKFEKHPYVLKADVEFDGDSRILVGINERDFVAVIYQKQKFSLLTENYEMIPVLHNTAFYELPIVTNAKIVKSKEEMEPGLGSDIRQAFKIIDALKFCDEEMYNSLAEINLNKGGDVLLSFSGLKLPVIFGRGDEARKILTLKGLWSQIHDSGNYSGDEYVDLRFNKQIFIGFKD